MGSREQDDQYADELRQKLPTYVTSLARTVALEALEDMDDEHPEHRVYALARWFDALIGPQP